VSWSAWTRKDRPFAEHVAELRQALFDDARQHLFRDRADVLLAPAPVLVRHLVRAEEGRDVVERPFRVQAAHDAQHLQLVRGREAVAGLRLDGRRARAQEPALAPERRGEQLLFAGGARPPHGRADAAARRGDLLVAHARGALLELVGAVAREDGVRVRVHEARRQDAPARVEDLAVRARQRLDLFAAAGPLDQPAADEQRAALDD
jgi:hypothetical protein